MAQRWSFSDAAVKRSIRRRRAWEVMSWRFRATSAILAILSASSSRPQRFGKIDVLVANAGIAKFAPVGVLSEELFDELSGILFKGVFFTVQKALPYLRDGASVVLVGAGDSDKLGRVGTSIYMATKAAVRSLARMLSAELLSRRIRVNVLGPGMTDTPIITREGGGIPGMTPEDLRT